MFRPQAAIASSAAQDRAAPRPSRAAIARTISPSASSPLSTYMKVPARAREDPRIERRDIGDMHIRPAVQSASDVTRDAGRLGLRHERGDLDAPRRRSQGIAVDHAIAEHHRTDAGGIEHKPVDRHAGGLFGLRLDWRPLMKNSTRRFAHGEISHDAAAAAMEERFAGTGQTGEQRLDCTAMIAAGRIDNAIGGPRLGLQEGRIIERADDGFDAVRCDRVSLRLAAYEAANPMAVGDKG